MRKRQLEEPVSGISLSARTYGAFFSESGSCWFNFKSTGSLLLGETGSIVQTGRERFKFILSCSQDICHNRQFQFHEHSYCSLVRPNVRHTKYCTPRHDACLHHPTPSHVTYYFVAEKPICDYDGPDRGMSSPGMMPGVPQHLHSATRRLLFNGNWEGPLLPSHFLSAEAQTMNLPTRPRRINGGPSKGCVQLLTESARSPLFPQTWTSPYRQQIKTGPIFNFSIFFLQFFSTL